MTMMEFSITHPMTAWPFFSTMFLLMSEVASLIIFPSLMIASQLSITLMQS